MTTIVIAVLVILLALAVFWIMIQRDSVKIYTGVIENLKDQNKYLSEQNTKQDDEIDELRLNRIDLESKIKALTDNDTYEVKHDRSGISMKFNLLRSTEGIKVLWDAQKCLEEAIDYRNGVAFDTGKAIGMHAEIAGHFCRRAECRFVESGLSTIITLAREDIAQTLRDIAEAAGEPM